MNKKVFENQKLTKVFLEKLNPKSINEKKNSYGFKKKSLRRNPRK